MMSMITHGASYNNRFSTILLAGQKAELSVEVRDSDLQGNDPLPPYLRSATVTLSRTEPMELRSVPMKGGGSIGYRSLGQQD